MIRDFFTMLEFEYFEIVLTVAYYLGLYLGLLFLHEWLSEKFKSDIVVIAIAPVFLLLCLIPHYVLNSDGIFRAKKKGVQLELYTKKLSKEYGLCSETEDEFWRRVEREDEEREREFDEAREDSIRLYKEAFCNGYWFAFILDDEYYDPEYVFEEWDKNANWDGLSEERRLWINERDSFLRAKAAKRKRTGLPIFKE